MFPVHRSESGSFQELAHQGDVEFGQLSILTIQPGCLRGGHYHTRKREWFCCIQGSCRIEMKDTTSGETSVVELRGNHREFIVVEPLRVHRVRNTGAEDCEVLIIASEVYDANNADTFRLEE